MSPGSRSNVQPSISGENFEVVCDTSGNTKLLGVQIDENLMRKIQIKSIRDKASREIGFLKYAKHFLHEVAVKNLYTAALFGTAVSQLTPYNCRGSKTVRHVFYVPSKTLIQSIGWKTIEQLINKKSEPNGF